MFNNQDKKFLNQIDAEHLISMYDLLPGTIFWIKDLNSTFMHVNKAFIQHKRLKNLSQIVGKTDFDFSPDYMAKQYVQDDNKILAGELVNQRLEVNMTRSGDPAWYSTSKRPLKSKEGEIIGSYGITRLLHKQADALSAVEAVRIPVDYIREHYHQQFTVEELAEISHLSVSALERRFKKYLSKTPKQFINEVRLENARRLLIETDISISLVVDQTGFVDHSYFSKQFRNFFGDPPSQLRSNHRDS